MVRREKTSNLTPLMKSHRRSRVVQLKSGSERDLLIRNWHAKNIFTRVTMACVKAKKDLLLLPIILRSYAPNSLLRNVSLSCSRRDSRLFFVCLYSIRNQMFACVSPHFHNDISREKTFSFWFGVFSILSWCLLNPRHCANIFVLFPPTVCFVASKGHNVACNLARKALGAKRCGHSCPAGWGLSRERDNIFVHLNRQIKAVPPPPLFHKKFRSTGHTTTLLSILSIRWELGVVSLICIWRKWVVFSWMTPITLLRKALGKCQVGLCNFLTGI